MQLILLQPLSLEMLGLTPAEKGRQAEHLKRARERSEEECKDLYVQFVGKRIGRCPQCCVQGFPWEEKQESRRFLGTTGEALKELKGAPRKVLIANKIAV